MSNNHRLAMSLDMSEIIEFVLPANSDYSDDDNGGAVRLMDASEDATYVVLDNLGNEYDEEFLIVNEDGVEGELLVDEELQGLLVGSRMKESPLDEQGPQYVVTELQLSEMGELVEEEQELDYGDYEHELNYSHPHASEREEEDLDMDPPSSPSLPPSPPQPPKPAVQPASKARSSSALQIAIRSFAGQNTDDDGSVKDVKPSEKMLEEFKGPRRYLLFDDLIATIVDFDEDSTPIVEFSMISDMLDEKLPVECGICPDVMHKTKLSKHQKTHLVPGTNRYACIYCTETYRDCKYLAGHARRHMGIRPYVCELCTLYFSTKQDLRVHNQRRHLEKEHICEMCGKTFAQNTQLKRHREATHEKKRRFQCQYCQKAYYKNFSLQEHIRNVHMGKRRMLKCPFCGMQCRDAHKMARHRKEMHLSQGTYVCHLCQEEFTDINYFDAHKRSIQCRSNTRRFVSGDENQGGSGSGSISGRIMDGQDDEEDGMGLLEEEYDEDDGLLVEDGQAEEQGSSSNRHYLTEGEPQYVQMSDYDNQRLLVENVVGEDADEDVEEEELLTEEQYFNAVQQHHQQQQQSHHHGHGQDYNDELIYEITLKTEDN
ncbi:zinc finger and SCAN domain-containing protein 21 [Drosophila teissieri]|uniref:zinc finger and SCAN domain-containing protein 21 n=1 Tax=Drosophila teissieri TaxID=7243 RepID=UPI001CBA04F1|nr:zinc finger and SCAN domain-containing protein 21 [Drosophila teissieri]